MKAEYVVVSATPSPTVKPLRHMVKNRLQVRISIQAKEDLQQFRMKFAPK